MAPAARARLPCRLAWWGPLTWLGSRLGCPTSRSPGSPHGWSLLRPTRRSRPGLGTTRRLRPTRGDLPPMGPRRVLVRDLAAYRSGNHGPPPVRSRGRTATPPSQTPSRMKSWRDLCASDPLPRALRFHRGHGYGRSCSSSWNPAPRAPAPTSLAWFATAAVGCPSTGSPGSAGARGPLAPRSGSTGARASCRSATIRTRSSEPSGSTAGGRRSTSASSTRPRSTPPAPVVWTASFVPRRPGVRSSCSATWACTARWRTELSG